MKRLDSSANRMQMKHAIIFGLVALMVGSSARAADQSTTTTTNTSTPAVEGTGYMPDFLRGEEGRGVGITDDGKTRLHLSLDAGFGYNSNPYSLANGNEAAPGSAPIRGDIVLKLRPILYLAARGKKMSFEMGLGADWAGFPGALGGPRQFVLFTGRAYGRGEVNQGGVASLFLRGDVLATREVGQLYVANFTHIRTEVDVGSTIRPGSVTKLDLDAQFVKEIWPQDLFGSTQNGLAGAPPANAAAAALVNANQVANNFNNTGIYGHARLNWRVMPKTSLFLEGKSGTFTTLLDSDLTEVPVWVTAGVISGLGGNVTGTLSVGYADTFMQVGSATLKHDNIPVSAEASLIWDDHRGSQLSAGVTRQMSPVPDFLDVFANTAYLSLNEDFGHNVTLVFAPSASIYQFGRPEAARKAGLGSQRIDYSFDGRVELAYHFKKWLALGIAEAFTARWTNADLTGNPALQIANVPAGAAGLIASASGNVQALFNRSETLLVLNMTY